MGLFFLLWNKTNVPIFFVSTEHGDRPCWPAGSADRPWGGWGPEPGLPEGCKAEALSQTKEVKRTRMVLLDSRWLFFFSLLCEGQTCRAQHGIRSHLESDLELRCGIWLQSQGSYLDGTCQKKIIFVFFILCLHASASWSLYIYVPIKCCYSRDPQLKKLNLTKQVKCTKYVY